MALNKERHKNFKIDNKGANFSFARKTNSVIVTGMEFVHVAKEYPIVFAKTGDRVIPLALLGLRNDENLFIDKEGKWDARYLPAFVRRYPFVLADAGGRDDTGGSQLAVCIDEGFAGFNTDDGVPLFNEDGNEAPLLENAIRFLKEYQGQHQRTEIFLNRLQNLELLTELTARAELAGGTKFSMGGLLVVEEKKLMALDKKESLELFRSGELGWIYAHLLSLSNMSRLADMLAMRNT